LIARLLATTVLWVQIQTSLKNTKMGKIGKQRSGQHTPARQKNYRKKKQLPVISQVAYQISCLSGLPLLAYVQDRPPRERVSQTRQEVTCTCRYTRVCGWLPVGYPLGVLAQCRTQSVNNKNNSEKYKNNVDKNKLLEVSAYGA
jgi:hypothetical protein